MPGLANPSTFNMPDGTARATQSSTDYVNYMNAKVFMPLNISMRYCPLATSNTDQILAYPFPAGSTPGNSFFVQGECGPGSWYLSGGDLFAVINELATGNTVLTPGQRTQMSSDCLGWDCAVRTDCIDVNVCKNGGSPSDQLGREIHTYAGIVKCRISVIVIINSPVPPVPPSLPNSVPPSPTSYGDDTIPMVADAYRRAEVPGLPQACP
jgi:hypothetical protein